MAPDDELQVTLREVAVDDIASARLPRDLIMLEAAERQVSEHVSADLSVERGGALVGQIDEQTGALRISGAVPSYRAQGTAASLTFTHDAWEEINEAVSENPDLRIVGWYHSHPDFGIFLSQYDKFIQENFFTERWQVAYVVDPVRRQAGLFGWENGAVVSIPKWQEMDTTGHAATRTNGHGVARDRAREARAARAGWGNALRVGFFALIIGLIGGYFIGRTSNSASVTLEYGSLPVLKIGSGLSLARSWAVSGSALEVTVTVENASNVPRVGSIQDCAPATTSGPKPAGQPCRFTTDPLRAKGGRSFQFSLPASGSRADPWAGLPAPSFLPTEPLNITAARSAREIRARPASSP